MHGLLHIRELISDRSLLACLVMQDLKLKYRGSVLGFLWAMLNPLLMLGVMAFVFTAVFSRAYPLHLFATFLPWQFFSRAQTEGCRAYTSSSSIILHWKTPLLMHPIRRTLFRFFEYVFSLVGLSVVITAVGFQLTPAVLALPIAMLLLLAFSMSLSIIMSVVSLFFKDMQHLVDVLMRAWFYMSPVILPVSAFPDEHRWVLTFNPMYYFLELFDAPIARAEWPQLDLLLIATTITLVTMALALAVFQRYESRLVFRV